MYKVLSSISKQSKEYRSNYEHNKSLANQHKKILGNVAYSSAKKTGKPTTSNKLLARERINFLVDPNSAFLEFSPLAAYGQYDNNFPSAGIITGVGVINGIETVLIANDASAKGGTYVRETIKKHLRAQEIAMENQLPCVYLVDSGGIFLPEQSNVFPDKNDFGRIFYNQARMSARGIPQIAIVMGSCTAGGAYIPAMSDETIIVENQGTIFIGGPPLVKAATGEIISSEELGGADIHTRISGVADHMAKNEKHALEICRNIFETLPSRSASSDTSSNYPEPLYDPDELYGIISKDIKKITDPREIIIRLADNSEFHEFKRRYGSTLVTGFSRITGYKVGIIANQGVLNSEAALKGTHFIELCNFRKIPILFLQNITGFIVGKDAEHGGIAKNGAKMVHAIATSVVPKFTIITGGSYGAGNYAMAGRAYNPSVLFTWPNSKIAVMGGEQAANVLLAIQRAKKKNKHQPINDKTMETLKHEIREKYENESSPYFSTSRLWDDGIIDPVDTRTILSLCLCFSSKRKIEDPKQGIYRM